MAMRNVGYSLVAGILAACLQIVTSSASDVDYQPGPTYDRPAIEIGGGIANDGGSGDINVLAPLIFSEGKDLLFFGADAKFSGLDLNDTGDAVYNVGAYLGYRRAFDDNNGVMGFWAGFDHFNTEQDNDFTRVIAGMEYFGPHVIARANGFVPLDNTSGEWTQTVGGFTSTLDEKVPAGFDAELGLRLAVPMDTFLKPGEFRIFAGGYDFFGLDDGGGDVLGGRARAEFDLYPFDEHPDTRLSFQASYAYDKHSGDQYGAGIRLSIPLGMTNKIKAHGAKDEVVARLDSFGQDLFQPIRRNRENVSRIRVKSRTPAGGGGTGGVTLSKVCGGANGSLTLNNGLASTTITQGALLGTIDPTGSATALNLNLGIMVAPNGQTLSQLLASRPQSINTTLTFPASTVDFSTQTVRPAAAVRSTSLGTNQKMTSATVTINNNSCSLNVENEDIPIVSTGVTITNVCGGTNEPILLSGGLNAASLLQGSIVANVISQTGSSPVALDIASMIDENGKTLAQLLANSPPSIFTVLHFPASIVDFADATISIKPSNDTTPIGFNAGDLDVFKISMDVSANSCKLNFAFVAAKP
jgi:hypothetical protein